MNLSFRTFIALLILSVFCSCTTDQSEKASEVPTIVRSIGHVFLLNMGDSTSRVLPIEQTGPHAYKLHFENDFALQPDLLVSAVDSIMQVTNYSQHYLVEVEQCDSNAVEYSYSRNPDNADDLNACITRPVDAGCYGVEISFLDASSPEPPQNAILYLGFLILGALGVLGYLMYRRNRREDAIELGKFRFDHNNMILQIGEEQLDLTSKESELLHLLYRFANNTVKKEDILEEVWEDNGNYSGRTLDVFISRLRKKLAQDPSIRLLNVKGVGYKLIISL
jgi:hypothetical protein